MTVFLDRVRNEKLRQIKERKLVLPEADLRKRAEALPPLRSFPDAIRRPAADRLSLIAEIKVKAPGRRNISALNVQKLVAEYEHGGARAISVLTDEEHFGGSPELLGQVRALSSLPLLHKEFIVDPYQLAEGRLLGADAALILVHYFTAEELREMIAHCRAVNLEPVVECSLEDELPLALSVNPRVLLLNNRPIAAIPAEPGATYSLGSVSRSRAFWDKSPQLQEWRTQADRVMVSASCIDSANDIAVIRELPFDAVLIGNAAASAADSALFLKSLQPK